MNQWIDRSSVLAVFSLVQIHHLASIALISALNVKMYFF